ncbi:MAG: hypothetical protein HWN67_18340 [Candidatus Helarchaeota archaeon]|nr:hypothetical protein [Candidatus Helarchaeota archaeon]
MRLYFQRISYNWLKTALKWFENEFLTFFIQKISKIFSFRIKVLQDLQIDIENKKFSADMIHIIAKTQKLNEKRFIIDLNEFKINKISHVSNDIRKYIVSVIIGHELIHIIQFYLKLIGSKREEIFSKTWIPFLREVKAYKYSQIVAAKHYTLCKGLPENQALKIFSPIFNYYHSLL